MDNEKIKFPKVSKSIEDFILDEDGNITRNRLVAIGTMIVLMSLLTGLEVLAKHGSHRSHSSHESHSSTAYIRNHTNHASHSDHYSHSSHASHSSHTSHSNTASHSNSIYSAEGDVAYGPAVSDIPGVNVPQSNEQLVINNGMVMAIPTVPAAPQMPATSTAQDIKEL